MRIGMIGLGKMGANMARRLRQDGAEIVGYDPKSVELETLISQDGVIAADSVTTLVKSLAARKIIWLMLPAGEITESYIETLLPLLSPGDILIDGANSYYKDSMRRAELAQQHQVEFVDAGVSGGIWGLKEGYALMLGGSKTAIDQITPIIQILAPAADRGWIHAGPTGSGHFAKMVHNGIEYGMMQAYAEGFALLHARKDFDIDIAGLAETWRHGSVVRSWLLDLTAEFLAADQELEGVEAIVPDSGEGRWTAIEGIELGIPTPIMSTALMMRFSSQGSHEFSDKLLAMMRNSFGGHSITQKDS